MGKVLKRTIWIIGILFLSAAVTTFIFKDKIVSQVVDNLNRYIDTPVEVASVDFNFWDNFPNTSLVLKKVNIKGSLPAADSSLLVAEKLMINLNPIDLVRGNYVVNDIILSNGHLHIQINSDGKRNFQVFKNNNQDTLKTGLSWSLNRIILNNISVSIQDETQKLLQTFESPRNVLSINQENDSTVIFAKGSVINHSLKLDQKPIVSNVDIDLDTKLVLVQNERIYFDKSILNIQGVDMDLNGSVGIGEERNIDLILSTGKSTLGEVIKLFPATYHKSFESFEFEGAGTFKVLLDGRISKSQSPSLHAQYQIENARIRYKENGLSVEDLNTKGYLKIKRLNQVQNAQVYLEEFEAILNNEPIRGSFALVDFKNPFITGSFEGVLSLNYLTPFVKSDQLKSISGKLKGNLSIEAFIKNVKKDGNLKARGKFIVDNVSVDFGMFSEPLLINSGNLNINNDQALVTDLEMQLLENRIIVDGSFNEPFYTLFENGPVILNTSLSSNYISFTEIESVFNGGNKGQSGLKINTRIASTISINLDQLEYKKFTGTQVKSKVEIKNSRAVFKDLEFISGGGSFNLYGILDTRKTTEITARGIVRDLYIDSLFYTFSDFNQDWITHENLKGRLTADILTTLKLNEKNQLINNSLVTDATTTIRSGELNDFEPMISLGKYIKDDNLDKLRFEDIENEVHIENGVVYLPEMIVKSNVTTIQISGKHGFDKTIDYRLIVPLSTITGYSSVDMEDAIDEGSKLHLKIHGTTDDYKISYDKESVKKKIIADLKGEVKELKEAFKKKEEDELLIELEEDEYIEWDTLGLDYKY